MYRRDFLKLSGLFSTAFFVQFHSVGKAILAQPLEVEAQGRLYRGSSDGKIHVSTDAGKSWQLHTNFGSELSILNLTTDLWGRLYTRLEYQGYNFDLALVQNEKNWRTA